MKQFEVTGKSGTVYVMDGGSNSQCAIETLTKRTYPDVVRELAGPFPSVTLARSFVRGLMTGPVTEQEAGNILDDIGGWEVISQSLAAAADVHLFADTPESALVDA